MPTPARYSPPVRAAATKSDRRRRRIAWRGYGIGPCFDQRTVEADLLLPPNRSEHLSNNRSARDRRGRGERVPPRPPGLGSRTNCRSSTIRPSNDWASSTRWARPISSIAVPRTLGSSTHSGPALPSGIVLPTCSSRSAPSCRCRLGIAIALPYGDLAFAGRARAS
jgi:hypothetical protein